MRGFVKTINIARGFGFVRVVNEVDHFFHVRDTDDSLPFDESLVDQQVEFEVLHSDRGPRAINVRAI